MKTILVSLSLLITTLSYSQVKKSFPPTKYPVAYVNGVEMDMKEVHKIPPSDIVSVMVYKDSDAVKKIGPAGKNGLMYISTKSYVRDNNWKFLKSKSPEYAKIAPTPLDVNDIQYIINGHLVNDNIEKTVGNINEKNFRSVMVIQHDELLKEYKVNKKYGVIILSDPRMPIY